jgi:hypothetical protein
LPLFSALTSTSIKPKLKISKFDTFLNFVKIDLGWANIGMRTEHGKENSGYRHGGDFANR